MQNTAVWVEAAVASSRQILVNGILIDSSQKFSGVENSNIFELLQNAMYVVVDSKDLSCAQGNG